VWSQVGHAGTLDPMATGLLIVCVGKATKIVDAGKPIVFTADVAAAGNSTSEFTDDARSHRFPSQQSRVRDCPLPGTPTVGIL